MPLRRRKEDLEQKEKVLDVDASMQGTLAFKDPVNLRINGKFEGRLETKGFLTIGEHAVVVTMTPQADLPDWVCTANAGVLSGD